ncbi:serine protease 27-like isoform X1 [Lepisosteus oculatus]|uniref:serine protease 27-like isoform X1 n=1 Tax=Lepisosteus oculatus TaxID=7918 RepID=UPI00372263FE
MKMFFLLAFFGILILNKEEVSSSPLSRSSIVGGQDAEEGQWPWQVYMQIQVNLNDATFCGGSLISEQWVLTAARCFKPSFLLEHSFVRLRAYKLDQPSKHEVKKSIKKVVLHEQYEKAADGFDIALVQLDSEVSLSPYISPVQLANPNNVFTEDTECWATGWGMTKENVPLAPPRTLQEVQLPIVDNRCCQSMYNSKATIREDMMCAGDEDGQKDTCLGDSGGPLVCKKGDSWIQAGIVSFGRGCGRPNSPGVYTRVSSFTDWIKEHSGV